MRDLPFGNTGSLGNLKVEEPSMPVSKVGDGHGRLRPPRNHLSFGAERKALSGVWKRKCNRG